MVTKIDLRSKMHQVGDQGIRPTCVSFALSACHEYVLGNPFKELSKDSLHWNCLVRDGSALNGNYSMDFTLYDSETGDNVVWGPETQGNVTVTLGMLTAYIGSVNSLDGIDFSKQYWLKVEIEGEEMTPRIKLVAVPYAMNSYYFDGQETALLCSDV